MKIEPFRSSMFHPPASQALTEPGITKLQNEDIARTQTRTRRFAPPVKLETKKLAADLIKTGDSELSMKYTAALMEQVIGLRTGDTTKKAGPVIADIPPFSTFGRAWAQLTHAIQSEPFASFASKHKIDTTTLRLSLSTSSWMEFTANGSTSFVNKFDEDWDEATAAVFAAARALAPDHEWLNYTGAHSAPADVIGNFYAAKNNGTEAELLYLIGLQQQSQSFNALREPGSKAEVFTSTDLKIRNLQSEAIEDFSAQIAIKPDLVPPSQRNVKPSVENADRQLALELSHELLKQHQETFADKMPLKRAAKNLTPFTTWHMTRRAFQNGFATDSFLSFARAQRIDISSIRVDPKTGDLKYRTTDASHAEKRFTLTDNSAWAALGADTRRLAKSLAAGSGHEVAYSDHEVKKPGDMLNFYAENLPTATPTLVDTLKRSVQLIRNGFPALNKDKPPTDARSRAVQEKQRAAIESLANPGKKLGAQTDQPTPAVNPMAEIAGRQFAGEPTLNAVIARMLSDAIKQTNPTLDFDVTQLAIESPDPVNPGKFKRTQLMELAYDYLAGGAAPSLAANERAFDTRPDLLQRTGNPAEVPLDLFLPTLRSVMQALPKRLNDAFNTQTREYWQKPAFNAPTNTGSVYPGSHRALVSSTLRNNLQMANLKQPGLDDEQRKTVEMVLRHPEGSTRPAPLDPKTSGVTVYSLSGAGATNTPNMLIQRFLTQPTREIVLLVEPSGKITPYTSLNDAMKAGPVKTELDGNMFDAQADIIIQHQGAGVLQQPLPFDIEPATPANTKLFDWMSKAGEAERFVLHDLSLRLASFLQLNQGRRYSSDIPEIHDFAQSQFDKLSESKKLTPYAAKDLEVVFKVAVGTLASGFIDRQTMSLTDMMLNNVSNLPRGQIEVYYKGGVTSDGKNTRVRVPALETEGALKKIVQDLDIGGTYSALLKEQLVDDPAKTAERRALFIQQVPIELQLKALELSTKSEAGFDAKGFRFVQEILKPGLGPKSVDGKEIVIRPLAFDDKGMSSLDVVEGAYLIEPKDSTEGPHILYRPLSADAPLLQFATRDALLEAIQTPGKLQKEILAWLPNDYARAKYQGNGFKHPNLVLYGYGINLFNINDTVPLAVGDPLQKVLQSGKLLEHLYDDNAQNLITLAGQQSTSTKDSRWALHKEGGYLLLNAVLPALRTPGALLGVLLQAQGVLNDLQILGNGDSKNKDAAMADLLVNLATTLIHFKPRSLTEETTTSSKKSPFGGSFLVDDYVAPSTLPKNRIVLGGPATIKPLAGDIQSFEDTYHGKPRLNIMGHALKPAGDEPASIIGEDDTLYSAEDIDRELKARGIDIRDYSQVRLLVCHSAHGGDRSLAAQLRTLTKVPVEGYEREIVVDYNGVNQEDPFKIYENASAQYRELYPSLSDAAIHDLAEKQLNLKLSGIDIGFKIDKENGKEIEVNIGSDEKPVFYRTKVDYRPRTFKAVKSKPVSTKPTEVLMGYSHTAQDTHSVLSTRSLTDCSALAVLTDLKDGVYQKRTLMHLTGSNLEFGLLDEDAKQVVDTLDKSLANGGKVIFVGGIDSQSTTGMGVVLGQSYQGKQPLLDILKKRGVETVVASSLGVDINPDGTFKLIEGTGKGIFSPSMVNAVFDFAA